MRNRTDQKPRFTRIVKGGQMWLRDRKATELAGPFASWAEALAYIKDAERHAEGEQSSKEE